MKTAINIMATIWVAINQIFVGLAINALCAGIMVYAGKEVYASMSAPHALLMVCTLIVWVLALHGYEEYCATLDNLSFVRETEELVGRLKMATSFQIRLRVAGLIWKIGNSLIRQADKMYDKVLD